MAQCRRLRSAGKKTGPNPTDRAKGGSKRSVLTEASRVLVVRQHAGSVGLLIDEVLGQRSFTDEQRNEAVGEADERYQRFVGENLQLGDVLWGLFSMAALVRAAEFQQGSA